MKVDGGSLFYVYGFLKTISELINIKLVSFKIAREDLILNKKFYEVYTSYDEFYAKFLKILQFRPFCETGAYFRLTQFKIIITDYLNPNQEVLIYLDNGVVKFTTKTSTTVNSYAYVVNLFKDFIDKLEYVISVRKARYVDPCYVDEGYIEETYQK